jgi:hypothetical protein
VNGARKTIHYILTRAFTLPLESRSPLLAIFLLNDAPRLFILEEPEPMPISRNTGRAFTATTRVNQRRFLSSQPCVSASCSLDPAPSGVCNYK